MGGGVSKGKGKASAAEVATVFERIDSDGSGSISAAELVQLLASSSFTPEAAQELVNEFDMNGDGELQVDEVAALWESGRTGEGVRFLGPHFNQLMAAVKRPATVDFEDLRQTTLKDADEEDGPIYEKGWPKYIKNPAAALASGCEIEKTEERAINLCQLLAVWDHVAKYCVAEGWQDWQEGALAAEAVTLYDACAYVIKPATRARECSFVELVADAPQPPQWFVSHWWGEGVKAFLSCLLQQARDRLMHVPHDGEASCKSDLEHLGTRYWVCAYANNQWQLSADVTRDPAESAFRLAMGRAVGTISVIDERAMCLQRIWCDYEVSTSLMSSGKDYLYDMYTAHPHTYRLIMAEYGLEEEELSAVGITDGLTWADDAEGQGFMNAARSEYKTQRELYFPKELIEKALAVALHEGAASVESDRVHILNAIIGRKGDELDLPPVPLHDQYERLNGCLAARIAAGGFMKGVIEGGSVLDDYLSKLSQGPLYKFAYAAKLPDYEHSSAIDGRAASNDGTDDKGKFRWAKNFTLDVAERMLSAIQQTPLESLDLCHGLPQLPPCLGRFINLKKFICKDSPNLVTLPEEFGDLVSLEVIGTRSSQSHTHVASLLPSSLSHSRCPPGLECIQARPPAKSARLCVRIDVQTCWGWPRLRTTRTRLGSSSTSRSGRLSFRAS